MENRLFYSACVEAWECDDEGNKDSRVSFRNTNIKDSGLLNRIEAEAIQQAYDSGRPIDYHIELDISGNELTKSF